MTRAVAGRLLACALAICARVEGRASAQADGERRVMVATRATSAIDVDGVLDDETWRAVAFDDRFTQKNPDYGVPPTVRTEIAIAYDGDALYVAARMWSASRADVRAVMNRRDDTSDAERIIVSLDTFRNRRTAASFALTAAGVRADWMHQDDSEGARDMSFNPVWRGAVRVLADGWSAEMRIPFTQLRFPDGDEQVWGININRYIPQRNEDIFWIAVPRDVTAWASYFGELRGLRGVTPALRLEVMPYLAGDATLTDGSLRDPDDPFADTVGFGGNAGVDAKLGLGPSLTLDAAINPDFGQVEADPAAVNLTAYEVTFAEQRPFFIEGSQLLIGAGANHYYSRRIGAAPRVGAAGDFVDAPRATRILGAAKLTGVLPSRTAIGALAAVTAAATAKTYDVASDSYGEQEVAPLTGWGILRVEQELGEDASLAGATLTAVGRDLGDPGLAAVLPEVAITGGGDLRLRSGGGTYELFGSAGFSALSGSADAIAAIQTSSAHYFQRPDQDHVALDPDATTIAGWRALLTGLRRSGTWTGSTWVSVESPGFELNDLGILQSADDLDAGFDFARRDTDAGDVARSWLIGGGASTASSFGLVRKPIDLWLNGQITFSSYWNLDGIIDVHTPGQNDDLTRGGPLMGRGWEGFANLHLNNGGVHRTQWNVGIEGRVSDPGESYLYLSANLSMRPVDRLRVAIGPRFLTVRDTTQYVDTIARADGDDRTFGDRYVFATIERSELSAQLRVQAAFTPDLILDAYLEPFISAGAYDRFGELASAGGRDLRVYGDDGTTITRGAGGYMVTDGADGFALDDPDFTVLSLRGTVVLRWELRPGSTLYVVWQESRGEARAGALALDQLGDVFAIAGQHTLGLKLSYWWSP